jgi:hypothetical protein
MAITQAMCSSFKQELLGGIHDLDTDVIKMALFTSSATLGPSTTAYSTANESVGAGYTAGGQTLTGATIGLSGTIAFVDFSDVVWPTPTVTARGALIYNASKANRAIAVLDFGSEKTPTTGDFVVLMPSADANNAIIRIF